MILLALACVHSAPPSPADCEGGDPAACHAVAATAELDDPVAWQLDRWACSKDHAEACLASAERYAKGYGRGDTAALAAVELRHACDLGLAAACSRAATLPDTPTARIDIGLAVIKACRAEDEAACARASSMGWRGKDIGSVRIVTAEMKPRAVLGGGTVLGMDGATLVADGPAGPFSAPLSGDPTLVVRDLLATVDGRVLTAFPGWVWSMLDGRGYATRTWPGAGPHHAWTPDGSQFVAGLDGAPLVAWWNLADGRVGDVIPTGRTVDWLDLAPDGRWIAVGAARSALVDRVTGTIKELPCSGPTFFAPGGKQVACWASGVVVVGVDGKVLHTLRTTSAGYAWSPDGTLLAVLEPERLLLIDAVELGTIRAEVQLPPGLAGRPLWSPDGMRILVPGAPSLVLSRPGARDDSTMDRAVIEGLRGMPKAPEGQVASRMDLTVSGRVTRAGGPARGAALTLTPCTPGPDAPPVARSGHDGSFSFARLPRGCWNLKVAMDGVEVTRRADGPLDIDLPAVEELSGTVKQGGRGVEATVAAWGVGDRPLATTRSDRRGRYTLSVAGATTIEAYSADHVGHVYVAQGTDVDLAAVYAPLRYVGSGHQDTAARAYPQDDGSVLLVGIAPGTTVPLRAVEGGIAGPRTSVTLPVDGTVLLPPVEVTTIHVHFARLGAADEVGVEGATCVRHADGCRATVASGHYRVYARRAGDHAWGEVEVDASGPDTMVEAPLNGVLTAITGRLVDATTGAALAGMSLTLGDVHTRSGPDGRFRLGHIHTGKQTLTIAESGAYAALRRPVEPGAEPLDLGDIPLPR